MDLDQQSKMIIFESLLTTLEAIVIIRATEEVGKVTLSTNSYHH
jgi:hypothetical protein